MDGGGERREEVKVVEVLGVDSQLMRQMGFQDLGEERTLD